MHHGRRVLLAIGIALAAAGCASSGSGVATGVSSLAPATAEAPAASAALPATSEAPSEAPATDGSTGSGSGGGVCDLATSAELGRALGRDVQTTLVPGPPDTCGFAGTDGTPLGAMVLQTSGGGVVFELVHQGSAMTDLPGIGDKAFYSTEMQTVTVLKGDALLTISVVSAQSDDERRDIETAIAAASAPRM